jgi:hypothetical protein
MDCTVSERRAHERTEGRWGLIAKATLRPGHPILLVNISRGGALIEGGRPLRPGTRVMLQVSTSTGALGLSALVLRCGVQSLSVGRRRVVSRRVAVRRTPRLDARGRHSGGVVRLNW